MYSTKTCTSSPTNSGLLIGLLVAQSCPTLCDPMDCNPPGSSVCWNSPGKNTGVGFHILLPPGDLPNPGTELRSPTLLADFLPKGPK